MSTETFYSELPLLKNFIDITDYRNFDPLPLDWYILVTDIIGSTKAIEAGRYKDVNLIGACSIAAVLNIAEDIEIPFVFGGDGASIVVPPSLLPKARRALLATQSMAKKGFNMDLRIGAVPVEDAIADKYDIKVAKLSVSENYQQAIFVGGGLTYATDLVKDKVRGKKYEIKNTELALEPDLSGLECRWQDIPSKHGETISLIVMATLSSNRQTDNLYKEVIEEIQKIYGGDQNSHPILHQYLNLSFSIKKLYAETKVRAKSNRWLHKILYLLKMQIENLLGFFFMRFKIKVGGMDWGLYKNIVRDATDYRKFDDMLRMVIAGNAVQRHNLTCYLEKRYKEGKLVYGLHVSNRALMTCLVFERNGRQVHFVDGADGGYALAAKAMKRRMSAAAKPMSR